MLLCNFILTRTLRSRHEVTSVSKIVEFPKEVGACYNVVDWDPIVKQNWVESYLAVLFFNKQTGVFVDAREDIHELIHCIERTVYNVCQHFYGGNSTCR